MGHIRTSKGWATLGRALRNSVHASLFQQMGTVSRNSELSFVSAACIDNSLSVSYRMAMALQSFSGMRMNLFFGFKGNLQFSFRNPVVLLQRDFYQLRLDHPDNPIQPIEPADPPRLPRSTSPAPAPAPALARNRNPFLAAVRFVRRRFTRHRRPQSRSNTSSDPSASSEGAASVRTDPPSYGTAVTVYGCHPA